MRRLPGLAPHKGRKRYSENRCWWCGRLTSFSVPNCARRQCLRERLHIPAMTRGYLRCCFQRPPIE